VPRKRQTQAGMPAQPVSPVAGQMYGAGVEQAALQQAMPSPQLQQGASLPATNPHAMQAPAASAPAPQGEPPPVAADQFAQLIARAQQLKGQGGLLTAPTNRPNEPVTAGLTRGLGPGPEALGAMTGNPTGATLRKLSQLRGDPYFAELADRAGI
jgi:hypothetical protein